MKLISVHALAIKAKAAFIHLLLSVVVASIAAYVVFGIWFPYPYGEVSGGRNLFLLVMWVDICCGPLLTFVLFSAKKARKELMLDLGLVVVIQLAALFYGVYTVMLARPVYLVFEVDRFRVVTAVDVVKEELPFAKKEFQKSSFFGPAIIAAQPPNSGDQDYMRTIELGMQGFDISSRPKYWVPYSDKTTDVLSRAKPLTELKQKNPNKNELIAVAIKETKLAEANLVYLPLQSRTTLDWVVLLDAKTATVVGFVHADGF
jgi:hypothetical protein